jgi:hypothetical protein
MGRVELDITADYRRRHAVHDATQARAENGQERPLVTDAFRTVESRVRSVTGRSRTDDSSYIIGWHFHLMLLIE